MKTISTTPEACRKFMRQVLNLDRPLPDPAAAIRHHGYIQIDPIDICGRMHDLILRNRVKGYRRDDLLKTLYKKGRRDFFEHYIPGRGILVALPVEDYRFLAAAMKKRKTGTGYGGALNADEKRLAARILRRLRDEGPLGAAAFADTGRSSTGWGNRSSLAKTTLDKLFFHGRVLVSGREHFRRLYDLPERVLPPEVLAAKPATPGECRRWLVLERLRQRRLVGLTAAQAKLVKDLVTQVKLADAPALYCLEEDAEKFVAAQDAPKPSAQPLLLGPLDPLIYDRTVTRRIWDFDYTWEVYTPQAKRVRGYYALPVLAGTRLIGHADPRADRATGVLHVNVSLEHDVNLSSALKELATFLKLNSHEVKHQTKAQ